MGYGRICAKVVLAVPVPDNVQRTDKGDDVTLTTKTGSVTLEMAHSVYDMPDELLIGRYGTDDMSGYYIICGRTFVGGGIWDDGGSVSPAEMAEDEANFSARLKNPLSALLKSLGLPDAQPSFKIFMSFGQVQY